MRTEKFSVTGMTCAACEANVTRSVKKLNGVSEVTVSLLANQMRVRFDENTVDTAEILRAVADAGYGAALLGQSKKQQESGFRGEWQRRQEEALQNQRGMKRRLVISIALLVPLMYVAMGEMLGLPVPAFLSGTENALISAFTQFLIALPVLFVNRKFFTSGFHALLKRAPNMDSLVSVGSGASMLYGIFAIYRMAHGFGHGDMQAVHQYAHSLYFESAAMILTLVTVGKYLEARSKSKTSDALGKLVNLAPKTAAVIRDGMEQIIPSEQVVAGDIVVIKPGQSIPVDGVILSGQSAIDESAISGESIPVDKEVGDEVTAATINASGFITAKATRVGSDTTLAKIIHMVSDEHGLNISQRNITASTCGIVPNIRRLAEEKLQITLALSLHGSNQEKRRSLMPVANKYELHEVLEACDYYFEKTGRRITFEYSLVHGVNDTPEDAKELMGILKDRNCHLNLIPVNPIKERNYEKPDKKSAENFKNKLEKNGINVTIRREMGSDIDGACGQLRRKTMQGV